MLTDQIWSFSIKKIIQIGAGLLMSETAVGMFYTLIQVMKKKSPKV